MTDHGRKGDDVLVALATQFDEFVKRYDREQTSEKEERDSWRGEILDKIAAVQEAVNPVVKDHDLIMRGGKWFAVVCASIWGAVKGWFFLKDHLKP